LECLLPSGFSRVFKHLLGSLGAYPRGLHSKVDCHNDNPVKTLLITTLPITLKNVALRIMDFVTMTKRMKTLLITTLPITLINVALRITGFTCNRFNLSLNLLLTV